MRSYPLSTTGGFWLQRSCVHDFAFQAGVGALGQHDFPYKRTHESDHPHSGFLLQVSLSGRAAQSCVVRVDIG